MEKEAKKEAFRKYLDSKGVLDALTKGLVALYEQSEKPSSAIEFIQQKLGGPSVSDYEKLQAEMSDLRIKYDKLLAAHQEKCKEVEDLKASQTTATTIEPDDNDDDGGDGYQLMVPSVLDYEKLQAGMSDLRIKYDKLLAAHQEKCTEVADLKASQIMETTRETDDKDDGDDDAGDDYKVSKGAPHDTLPIIYNVTE